jgi:hypothetical protein
MAGPTQFTLSSIRDIDRGKIELAINHALKQCVLDIEDRPGDKAKRKVTIQIEMTPQLDKNLAVLDTVAVQFRVATAIPVRQSSIYPMLPSDDGVVMFQPDSMFDPRQSTFAFPTPPASSLRGTPPPGMKPGERMDPATGEIVADDDDVAQI